MIFPAHSPSRAFPSMCDFPARSILVRSMSRILAFVVTAALAGCATQDVDWHLSQPQALAIAKNALTANNFQPSRYPHQHLSRFTDTRDWHIEFSPRYPGPGGNDVLVVLNDDSQRATVHVLPTRWSGGARTVIPELGGVRQNGPFP